MEEAHAVRWARQEPRRGGEMRYTRWHWTDDGDFTACRRPIPLGLAGTFFPETDAAPERITCVTCRQRLVGSTKANA